MAAHKGSLNHRLLPLAVGEYIYVETDNPFNVSRMATAASRYPAEMKGRQFTCSTWTAVSATQSGHCRVLLRIERTV